MSSDARRRGSFSLKDTAASRSLWPHELELRYAVTPEQTASALTSRCSTRARATCYHAALHTYCGARCHHGAHSCPHGLEYEDNTNSAARTREEAEESLSRAR